MVTLTQVIECIEQGKIRYERIDSKDANSMKQNKLNEEALETMLSMLKDLKQIHSAYCSDLEYFPKRIYSEVYRTFANYPKLLQPIQKGQIVTFRMKPGHNVTIKVDKVAENNSLNHIIVEGKKRNGTKAGFSYKESTLEDRIISIDGVPLADCLTH